MDRVERYFEMAAQEAPEAELDVELIIPTPPKLANRIIELRDVSVELGGRTLFQHVNLNLAAGERLGVVGRNGLGKSSLLKVILQELPAASGAVEIGARTQINYVDQNRLLLDDEKTVWEEVGRAENTSRSARRASRCALICGDFFSAKTASTRRFHSSAAANGAGCCSLKS